MQRPMWEKGGIIYALVTFHTHAKFGHYDEI